jgi:hypothetical protein
MASGKLKTLYPNLSDESLVEAAENLDRYLLVAWEIMEQKQSTDSELEAGSDQAYHPNQGRNNCDGSSSKQ